MRPRTGRHRLPGALLLTGLVLTAVSGFIWYPRLAAVWGRGAADLGSRAREVAQALGLTGPARAALVRGPGGAQWVWTWREGDAVTTVALSPTGQLEAVWVQGRGSPSPACDEAMTDLLRTLPLPQFVGTLEETGEGRRGLRRPDGSWVPLTFSGSWWWDLGRVPPLPRDASLPLLWPALAALLLALVAGALGLKNAVDEGRLNVRAGWSLVLVVTVLALGGHAGLFSGLQSSSPGWAVPLALAMGMVVALGCVVKSSAGAAPDAPMPLAGLGWAFAALGVASLALLVPSGGVAALAAVHQPGAVALRLAASLAWALVFSHGLSWVWSPARAPWGTVLTVLSTAAVTSWWLPGPLWLSSGLGLVLALLAELATRFHGTVAGAQALAVGLGAWAALPALVPGGVGAGVGVAGLLLAFVAPLAAARMIPSRDLAAYEPAFVGRLREEVRTQCFKEFSGALQSGLCAVGSGVERAVEVASVVRRAGAPASDFCRVVGIGRDRVAIVMGEVPKPGAEGALQACVLSAATLATLADGGQLSRVPEQVARVARDTLGDLGGPARLAVAVLDARSKTLSYLCAGHRPVLLHRTLVDRWEQVTAEGPPLTGPGERGSHTVSSVQLVAKDLLVFSTDGLDALTWQDGRRFSWEDLQEMVDKNPGASCGELAATWGRHMDEVLGSAAPPDDVVVLFVRSG